MMRILDEGPMWRRALAATAAMVLASAVFVGAVLLATDAVVDLALVPAMEAKDGKAAESTQDERPVLDRNAPPSLDKGEMVAGGES